VQRLAVAKAKRHADGDLGVAQREQQAVLIEDRLTTPAPWPIELRNEVRAVVEPQVVDAILERVEREAVSRRMEAAGLDRLEDAIGREAEEGLVRTLALAHARSIARPTASCLD